MCAENKNPSARIFARTMIAIGILFSIVGLVGTLSHGSHHDYAALASIAQLKFLLPCGVIILAWVNIKLTDR